MRALAVTAVTAAAIALYLVLRRRRAWQIIRAARSHRKGRDTWIDTYVGKLLPQSFSPYTAMSDHGSRLYALRTDAGLEQLAADEIASTPGCAVTQRLLGKLLFAAPSNALAQLRSAEELSLVAWAAPTPTFSRSSAAPRHHLADFDAFYAAQSPAAAAWLRELESLLRSAALPGLRALEDDWRRAVNLPAPAPIAFRVSVRRTGAQSADAGVSSVAMEQLLGGLIAAELGWAVALKRHALNVFLQWSEAHCVLELPLRTRTDAPYGERLRPWLPGGALRGPVSWGLARLAVEAMGGAPPAGGVVIDPCVGRGGLLVEAALALPGCRFVGCDCDAAQLRSSAKAARRAGCASRVGLLHADCTRLPLEDGSVGMVVVDLPFGKKHKSEMPLSKLYELTLAELCRVMRVGGALVALTTHKHLLSRVLRDEERWLPVARHELSFGGLTAYAIVVIRKDG